MTFAADHLRFTRLMPMALAMAMDPGTLRRELQATLDAGWDVETAAKLAIGGLDATTSTNPAGVVIARLRDLASAPPPVVTNPEQPGTPVPPPFREVITDRERLPEERVSDHAAACRAALAEARMAAQADGFRPAEEDA